MDVYIVVNEEYFGGDNIRIFRNKQKAEEWVRDYSLITRGLQDIIIVPGKASREKVYLTVNEDWYGDPKCFDNISECEAYINQQNKHTLKLEKIIE